MQIVSVAVAVAVCAMLVSSNPYGEPTYQDASYEHQAAPSYQPSYQPAAPAYHQPSYQAPAYPKYQAPSSAHHTQYDNYYPKQTYSRPVYQPQPSYHQQQSYSAPSYSAPSYPAPKPAYPAAPAYGHDMEEYKA